MSTATRAGQLGLNQREVVSNVITALTSNQMIAPSYWVDPESGNDYMLTVQYPESRRAEPAATCAAFRSARRAGSDAPGSMPSRSIDR